MSSVPQRDPGTLRLVLVRHGVTEWNTLGRMQGHSDIPLSPLGERQAEAVAAFLADARIEAAYSSDLRRASATASAIAAPHGLTVGILPELRETMLGDWEGLTDAEIVQRGDGQRLADYRRDPAMFRPPGSEAVESVAGRICSARAHIAGQSPDASVVVVGHGGSLRALFCDALRAPIHCLFGFRLDNASVSVIDYGRTRASIRSVNVTHHLGRLGPGSAR